MGGSVSQGMSPSETITSPVPCDFVLRPLVRERVLLGLGMEPTVLPGGVPWVSSWSEGRARSFQVMGPPLGGW
ncbi:hypothetical protein ASD62_04520 [Phycicoccus sp. Root563]|nr:hypothetical protein ASD62_04520 [Phycicoccus sp. Root563]